MSELPFHRAAAITLVVQSSAFCQATFCFRLPSNYSAEGKKKSTQPNELKDRGEGMPRPYVPTGTIER